MGIQLSEVSDVGSVENIVFYISDSLRDDYLPESVAEVGVRVHAISPSTYTASSLPSILTSQFPHEHNLWDFSYQLPETPYLLKTADSGGINVDTVWGNEYKNEEKPTLSLLNIDQNTRFEDLESPFTYIVHDHGGHSPYGMQGEGFTTTTEFFEENNFDREEITKLYKKGVEESVDRFFDLYNRLEQESLLENTLVIFTSDHGELLGEYGGVYEHTSPMVPETVAVPVVFCGAGLSNKNIENELISSIDLAPTALSAQGRSVPRDMRGLDLWSDSGSDRLIRADVWRKSRFGKRVRYAASSVWNEDGGIVVHRGSRFGRTIFAIGTNLYLAPHAPFVRQQPLSNLRLLLGAYFPRCVEYGTYSGSHDPGKLLEAPFEKQDKTEEVEVDRDKLEALGYIE